jgi:chemotaxis signal transduction protein
VTADAAAGAGPGEGAGRFLVVRAGGERFGLDLAAVREVVDLAAPRPVPARVPAVRGVMPLRERFYTLVHLGALMAGGTPPPAPSETAVLTDLNGRVVAFEVDDVEAVVEGGATLVGSGSGGGIADIWRVGGELVSALDLAVLAARLTETGVQA